MGDVDYIQKPTGTKPTLADCIADSVLTKFAGLPAKYKPSKDSNEVHNWVPLSGIVLEDQNGSLECVSLATGMKCLPISKLIQAQGRLLHDSHAEILALRAFNHFLLQESARLIGNQDEESRYLIKASIESVPFQIRPCINIHMYCSEAPCGDASMELIMQKQNDATPWTAPRPSQGLQGRGNFSELGVVRRKPARGDSPESLSKSCSDKLALRQCTSILASHTSLLIAPGNAYLTSIIIPESQFVPAAIIRCFSREGRMKAIDDSSWGTGYSFRPFKILTTSKEFSYSKRRIPSPASLPRPSNLATVWNPHGEEVSINGILQGRKQTDINCASMLSRVRLVAMVRGILGNKLSDTVSTYTEFKQCHPQLIQRADVKNQVIKQALTAWIRNSPDCFELRTPPLPSRRTSVRVPGALDTGIRQHCYIQGLTAVAKLGRLK